MSELGQLLKETRDNQNMTLEDLQEITKIQKRYLEAIENGDYTKLPGKFYARAFVKSYAEAVGLDPYDLFEQYDHELPKVHDVINDLPSRSQTQSFSPKPSAFNTLMPKILLGILIVGLVVAIYLITLQFTGEQKDNEGQNDTSDQNVVIDHDTEGDNGATKKNGDKAADNQDRNKDSNQKTEEQSKKPQPKLKLEGTQGSTSTFQLTNADQINLTIKPKSGKETWIDIRENGPSGDKIDNKAIPKNGMLSSEAQLKLKKQKIWMKVGSTGNIQSVKVNGQKLEFPIDNVVQKVVITLKK
ncbi:helix-turn-helix domain-containing protein [Tuberibacillus sp. Marseille-P3662]|uniref:helix-turn-helix domain-containing protein n=1 Tax=Tuberibacillus sp. Marseille-P3662 TaxID=1965358 RepID=UPI0015947EFB|nr:helix-turn-helix domain-containing protein [Tuberibacillus sp. Marseille-P3662]